MSRHAVLYDLQRWRRNRLLLIGPAALCYGVGLLLLTTRPQDGAGTTWLLFGSILLAAAVALWARQHFTHLSVRGQDLQVRAGLVSKLIPLREVRRVRVATLGSVLTTPQRRRGLPGGARSRAAWLATEAVVIRLGDGIDMGRLRRVAGRRCVLEHDLVVPVVDAAGLAAEMDGARPAPATATRDQRRRKRR
ncbi:MAG TPA: hypothetical protein VI316_04180 [Candidatus Dormibacteraeota bacterium]